MSMIPGPSSSRSRQSWVCTTPPGTENSSITSPNQSYRLRDETYSDHSPNITKTPTTSSTMTSNSNSSISSTTSPLSSSNPILVQRRPLTESPRNQDPSLHPRATSASDRSQQNRRSYQQEVSDPSAQSYRPSTDTRYDLYDRTRPESIYSRPSSEQIYDRIKDPIYERVRPGLTNTSKSLDQQRYPISRAEPQVPIYRPGRRIVTRRASEGSGMTTDEITYGSVEGLRTGEPGSRLSVESRRDSSPASKDSLSSYDSNSTLTGNECSDDSVIMTRLRKSFEQKEEFLRRPSHPIGWLVPDDPARKPGQAIQREFYARPQKLQRQVWPPSEMQQQQQQQQQQASPARNSLERTKNSKPSNQNVQRVRTDLDAEPEYSGPRTTGQNGERIVEDAQAIRDRFYSSLYDVNGQYAKENHLSQGSKTNEQFRNSTGNSPRVTGNNNKAAFVTTLSRIHENVTSANQLGQQPGVEGGDGRNGTSSLPSSPGLDKKTEKFPVPPQGLQIVSRRAKQFESGRLLSDDDEPTSDRTNLYKSELSRLSSKRSVPNVAVRKREFESKAESQDIRRIAANRESKSLDSGKSF